MSPPLWVAELAAGFWQQAGGLGASATGAFPRLLRGAILRALPLTVIDLPGLRLDAARVWLQDLGLASDLPCADRPLRALLAARSGFGLVFLDSRDDPAEQRFSLAHEVGHFLRHYQQVRQRAVRRLGTEVLQVLDGQRPPTAEERLSGLLRHCTIGCHHHLLAREAARVRSVQTGAEAEADQLAFELLAPAAAVFDQLRHTGASGRRDEIQATATKLLTDCFGLPPAPAHAYAALLVPAPSVGPVAERLRRLLV